MMSNRFLIVVSISSFFLFLTINYRRLRRFPNDNPSKFGVTVVYIYSGNDEQYPANLAYFLRKGVREDDGNKYYLVLQQHDWKETVSVPCICSLGCPGSSGRIEKQCSCKCPPHLENLPRNVKLVYHENKCFDMGTFGELWDAGLISRSDFYIILNSSIRGPFLPVYMPESFNGQMHSPLV